MPGFKMPSLTAINFTMIEQSKAGISLFNEGRHEQHSLQNRFGCDK
jgi:hypothetical protein